MRVFYGLDDLPQFKNAVLTIGTYDGVHFGHQQIIKRINEIAHDIDGESILLTFDPHPRLVLNPNDNKLKLISTIDEKIELLEQFGLDNLVIIPFSNELANTDAVDYIKHILIEKFHPKYICVGYDHHFGKDRKGNIKTLAQFAPTYHYTVEELWAQTVDEIKVSSTKVRDALLQGDIATANEWLSHPFTIKGKVIHGDKIGRILGFPTANIEVSNPHKLIPASGVYAVWVDIDDQRYKGALSIGYRPTVFDNSELTIEVFIIDFDANLYDKNLSFEFVTYLRPQIKFENWDLLQTAIENDVRIINGLLIE
ncbi:MAG: bifunctional riboflavin kinase/FAD synthetase [Chitinophagales bacterium]|nr:bifunctional riboflavin kinase/FAD synthetase [Chitinophagales bacterium]